MGVSLGRRVGRREGEAMVDISTLAALLQQLHGLN